MPQFKPPVYEIWMDIPDQVYSLSTTVKRRIKAGALHIDYPNKQVVINYEVHPFIKNDDNTYGESLAGTFGIRSGKFVASNDSIVTQQGQLLGTFAGYVFTEDGELSDQTMIKFLDMVEPITLAQAEAEGGPLFNVVWLREWDFYFYTSENAEVKVGDLVRGTFMQGVAGGRI